ncbi:MAG: conjugal transfer protein TraX [Butyricicoccus sp.]|nr:conjugal transfer protein TraX [Butyricicoccus sp.]
MRQKINLTSEALHALAMALMLCDHLWATLFPAAEWMTCLGRLAFPIFAFMTAEGYARTHDIKRYMLRMLAAALVSEIPFNLMYADSVFYPFHQNVLWTLLLGLALLYLTDKARERFRGAARVALYALLVLLGFFLGYAAMLDYYGVGVMTVLVFRFFPCRGVKNLLCQLACLYVLNVSLLGGYYYEINILGHSFELVQQGFALLSLIPIWLYGGRRGSGGKGFRYFCYAFYPAHMLLLFLTRAWVLR